MLMSLSGGPDVLRFFWVLLMRMVSQLPPIMSLFPTPGLEVLNASASGDYMESQVIRSKSVVMVKLRAAALFFFLFVMSCGAAQTIGMRALFVSVYEFSDCTAEAGLDP